jgi:hypothetical protein
MLQNVIQTTATERLVARLRSEGWVDCSHLGFLALSQYPLLDLRTFVLNQLQRQNAWMWKVDLQLATLIFSVPAHEFQFHPHLQSLLKQLQIEGVIQIQERNKPTSRGLKPELAIMLVSNGKRRSLQEQR